jgi:phospholipid/cholesterol/gamma-HCH transport system substrate-binding protein
MILFAIAVMAITKESRMFVAKVEYWTRFENTSGLTQGSPVRLVGVQIGTVDDIEFPEDIRETKIKVGFKIDRAYANRIRATSRAFLKSLTYLSQDKYVELTPGDPDSSALPPRGYIEPGVSAWEEAFLQSQSIADDVKEITASLRDLLVALNRGGGIVQEMIHNPEFGRQSAADTQASLAALRQVLEMVARGKGLAGSLLSDEQFGKRQIENIDRALEHFRSLLERVDDEEGLIAQLGVPNGKGSQALEDFRASAASLRRATEGIEKGKGLLGRLFHDEKYAEQFLKKMDGAVGHADSILKKIDEGTGTIGGMVNDPEVYQGLKDVVGGLKGSRTGKGLIRHYGKKGAKSRDEQEGSEDEGAQPEVKKEKPPDRDPSP